MPATVPAAGTYTINISAGFTANGFRLDSAIAGRLDDTSYVLDGDDELVDVSNGTTRLTVQRGRKRKYDRFPVGVANFTLNDSLADAAFNPFDSESPFYDGTKPGLSPGRAVTIFRGSDQIFDGFIVEYDYRFGLDGNDEVRVSCADQFFRLAQTQMNELNVNAETSGQRIDTVLDLTEVDYPGGAARNIDTGTTNLGHSNEYKVPAGTITAEYLRQVNAAEQGQLFITRDGVLRFIQRTDKTLSSPAVTFADDGTGTPYDQLDISFPHETLVNRAVVDALNGTTYTADNVTSQTEYLLKSQYVTGSLLHTASEVQALAEFLLEPDPTPLLTSVRASLPACSVAQRTALAQLDIGDTVLIKRNVTLADGSNLAIDQEARVEGIKHDVRTAGGATTIYTSPTTIVYELVLDNATFGRMDENNVLGG